MVLETTKVLPLDIRLTDLLSVGVKLNPTTPIVTDGINSKMIISVGIKWMNRFSTSKVSHLIDEVIVLSVTYYLDRGVKKVPLCDREI